MIYYICLGAYGLYCCSFCSMVIYTECKERYEEHQQRKNEYHQVNNSLPNIEINMINEREFARTRLFAIPEVEEEKEEEEITDEIV